MLSAVIRIGRRFSFPRLFTCVELTRQTTLQLPILMFHATLKILFLFLSLSVFVYIIRLLLFNSMFNVSGHGQMAIVSLRRFVTVVAVQQRPDRTESGAGREAIGTADPVATYPLPSPIASSCVECFDCKKLDSFSFCESLILRL